MHQIPDYIKLLLVTGGGMKWYLQIIRPAQADLFVLDISTLSAVR